MAKASLEGKARGGCLGPAWLMPCSDELLVHWQEFDPGARRKYGWITGGFRGHRSLPIILKI